VHPFIKKRHDPEQFDQMDFRPGRSPHIALPASRTMELHGNSVGISLGFREAYHNEYLSFGQIENFPPSCPIPLGPTFTRNAVRHPIWQPTEKLIPGS
jgi:hypothetical protein